ncbi:hypothetical protein DINM_004233 [Dirofilaria immitis]|nr:hypothetical protein [Dirofilaria immitis]
MEVRAWCRGMLLLPSVILCYFWRVAAHSLLPVIVDTIVTSRRHQLESDRLQTGSSSSSLSVAYIRLFVHIDCQNCIQDFLDNTLLVELCSHPKYLSSGKLREARLFCWQKECRDINFITEADIDDDTAVEKDACTVAFTV